MASTSKHDTPWKIILIGWTIYALYMSISVFVVREGAGNPISWLDSLGWNCSYVAVWILFTPVVLSLSRSVRIERGRWVRGMLIHLAASILVGLLQAGIHGVLLSTLKSFVVGTPIDWKQFFQGMTNVDYGVQLYWVIFFINYGHEYYTRYRKIELTAAQLETELAQAQLQALKMQIRPHFLFNTLHTIGGLVRNNEQQGAVTMIAGLSDLLRHTMDSKDTHEVPLRQELEFLERYLSIEKVRFSDRLKVEIAADPDTLDVKVPNLILQPLVENALEHGLAPNPGGGTLVITAQRKKGFLELTVSDNGVGSRNDPLQPKRNGIGLTNTRQRLQHLYNDKFLFEAHEQEKGGFISRIQIPINADGTPEKQ